MEQPGGEAGADPRVRSYLVDKLKLMHKRLLHERGAEGEAPSAEEQAFDPGGLLEHLPYAVFTMDLEGRILYVNREAEKLTGYPREELAGRPYYETDILHFRDLIRIAALFTLTRGERSSSPFRLMYHRKSGEEGKMEASVHLVPRGKSLQILCTAREAPPAGLFGAPTAERRAAEAFLDRAAVPISLCEYCKRVEDIDGGWIPLEYFLYKRLEVEFMHETCPDCLERKARGEIG